MVSIIFLWVLPFSRYLRAKKAHFQFLGLRDPQKFNMNEYLRLNFFCSCYGSRDTRAKALNLLKTAKNFFIIFFDKSWLLRETCFASLDFVYKPNWEWLTVLRPHHSYPSFVFYVLEILTWNFFHPGGKTFFLAKKFSAFAIISTRTIHFSEKIIKYHN